MRRLAAAAGVVALAGGAAAYVTLTGTSGVTLNPGDSIQTAYAACGAGETITLAPGVWPTQVLNYVAAKEADTGRCIVEASGASMPALELKGVQHLEFRNLTLTGQSLTIRLSTGTSLTASAKPAKDLLFSGLDAKTFLIRNARDVTIRDSRVGGFNQSIQNYGVPKTGSYSPQTGVAPMPLQGVLLERILFHDIIRTVVGSSHVECLFVEVGSEQVTVRDSRFTNCGVFDIFVEPRGTLVKDLVIEGNFLDIPRGTSGEAIPTPISLKGGPFENVTIRWNSILGNVRTDSALPNWGASGVLSFYGNAWRNTVCNTWPAAAFVGNVQSIACGGSGNTTGNPGFVSSSLASCNLAACPANDLHLASGALAIGKGPANPPALDIDSEARTDGDPDAGADEVGGTPPPTDTTVTEPPPTTTTEPPPVNADLATFCSEYVPNAQAESNYAKWLIQNPGEKSRWEPYRDGVCGGGSPAPPVMLTAKGKGLVAAGKMTG